MEPDVLAHWVGVFGEGLNFIGAVVLAGDIFLRHKEERRAGRLAKLSAIAARNGLHTTTYKDVRVSNPHFAVLITHKHASRVAYVGIGLMALGFLCLICYHGLEIKNINQSTVDIPVGISENQK